MSLTFDIFKIQTVSSDYSWDEGTPLVSYPVEKLVTHEQAGLSSILTDIDELSSIFIGYAPFVSLSLSSEVFVENTNLSALAIERIADFGDYYNSQTNAVKVVGTDPILFCHNFIMPGKYLIKGSLIEHIAVKRTLPGFEDFLGIYVQPTEEPARYPLSWQWKNFYCFSPLNIRNTPIAWEQTSLLQSEQLTWSQASGPCYEFPFMDIIWRWNQTLCAQSSAFTINQGVLSGVNTNPYNKNINWNEVLCDSELGRTWKQVKTPNCFELVPSISSVETSSVEYALLEVREVFPTAYLSAGDLSSEKLSPLTVRLTPRFTRAGSFPIEKIVWDLGDGTPLLTQSRAEPNINSPFVFSDALTADWKDPRNFDVIHTYTKTTNTEYSFYPSITAYASSTSSTDSAATIVGPLKLPAAKNLDFTILQNELTNHGKTIIADVDGSAAAWKSLSH